jgi:hypothetical protein
MKLRYLLFALTTLFLVQCSDSSLPTSTQLDSSINGKTAYYSPGQILSVELDLHADGGYQWKCAISDTTIVRTNGDTSYRPKNPVVVEGGMTLATLHYRTLKAGHATIRLTEIRIWEQNVPPINAVQFDVVVR